MGRAPITRIMQQAKHSLYLVMYGFTDTELMQALIAQKEKGIDVRVILEKSPYRSDSENVKAIHLLEDHHIPYHLTSPSFRYVHQKTLIVDGKTALIMTFNFTHSTFKKTRNFALEIDEPILAKQIELMFLADWQDTRVPSSPFALIESPTESRAKLLALIHHTQSTLNIYAQSLTDRQIIRALAEAAHRGVNITLLTSMPLQAKPLRYLKKAGVTLRHSPHYYIHAKAWIIDDKMAVVGSINLTRTSLDQNRELAVLSTDPRVIQALQRQFDKDTTTTTWSSARQLHRAAGRGYRQNANYS
jgi:phosphatidylserine/phosphatidylglycerophosphate/cardiolipin synthase-like enzyme